MAPIGPACKLCGCEPAEARVRAAAIIVVMPLCDQLAGMAERAERRLVEALVAQPAIERLVSAPRTP